MTDRQDREAYQQRMGKLRWEASHLAAAMREVAERDVDFTKVFNTATLSDIGWDQLIIDLEALAGLARMET